MQQSTAVPEDSRAREIASSQSSSANLKKKQRQSAISQKRGELNVPFGGRPRTRNRKGHELVAQEKSEKREEWMRPYSNPHHLLSRQMNQEEMTCNNVININSIN